MIGKIVSHYKILEKLDGDGLACPDSSVVRRLVRLYSNLLDKDESNIIF